MSSASAAMLGAGLLAVPLALVGCGSGGSTTPSPDPVVGTCAPVMPGIDCVVDADLKQHENVSTTGDCCDLCSTTDGCSAYTHIAKTSECFLKSWCSYLVTDWDNKTGKTSAMLSNLKPKDVPEQKCLVPYMGEGYNCVGEDAGNVTDVSSPEGCCDACMSNDACLIYSWEKTSQTCYFKHSCPNKTEDANFTTGWAPPQNWESARRFVVGRGFYTLDGYLCGEDGSTVIFYPLPHNNSQKFNVVVYGHGALGEIDGSDQWLEMVASMGLIVVAPFQGKDDKPCKDNFTYDLLNALRGSQEGGADLHSALATADFSRTGIFGHSKGAKYAPLAASIGAGTHNVKAMVASSDAPDHLPNGTEVPSMFTTGTLDKFNDKQVVDKYFNKSTATPKVFANLMDAYHMEVQEGMRLNVFTAQFLSCHVAQSKADCDVIYGTGPNSLCQANAYQNCTIVGHPNEAIYEQAVAV